MQREVMLGMAGMEKMVEMDIMAKCVVLVLEVVRIKRYQVLLVMAELVEEVQHLV